MPTDAPPRTTDLAAVAAQPRKATRPLNLRRARYALAQGARVAWYAAHYALAYRLTRPLETHGEPAFRPKSPPGDPKRIRQAFLDLFAADLANIEAGLYPPPADFGLAQAAAGLANSARFLADLPNVQKRRLERRGVEVRQTRGEGGFERMPAYYLQNFHYQSGGWLTEDSAKLYDTQVEVLFTGAAAAMRRIALGALSRALAGLDQRQAQVLDLACGNGQFMAQALAAFPRLNMYGLDLSPAYAAQARARLAPWPQAEIVTAAAEAAPFADDQFDALVSIYLFHELPPRVRRDVAREIARLVKPGGAFVFADSLQAGDTPDLDQMLEYFPVAFHEPFYGSYQKENFREVFGEAGFDLIETELAFLTKVMRFRRRG